MYERTFGTDWEEIDGREEAVDRAFALGVAAKLGETHPGELDRISDAVDTSYDQSFVELAYHEGREKADAVDAEGDQELWDALVEGETEIDSDARPEPGFEADNSLPGIVSDFDVDPMPDDSIEQLKRPSFLDRESDKSRSEEDVDRTMFGRPREQVADSGSDSPGQSRPEQQPEADEVSESDGDGDETEDADGNEDDADG